MGNLDKMLHEWASEYADECYGGEYDYIINHIYLLCLCHIWRFAFNGLNGVLPSHVETSLGGIPK